MKKLFWVALALASANACADTNAFDGNWIHFLKNQTPGETAYGDYWYEANTFTRNGDMVTYWEKNVMVGSGDFKIIAISHNVVNCVTQQSAQIAIVTSSGYGSIPQPSPADLQNTALAFQSYAPNSPGAKVVQYICKIKP